MAGPWYVRSTDGDDASDGLSWANAKATLAAALTAAGAGGTVYVSQAHAESKSDGDMQLTGGTASAPITVICVNDAAEPPTAVATTATVTTTSNRSILFSGFQYHYGVTYTSNNEVRCNTAPGLYRFESCKLALSNTGTQRLYFFRNAGSGALRIELHNTPLQFNVAGQFILLGEEFRWTGTTSGVQGTVPTVLFDPTPSGGFTSIFVAGVDLSALGSGKSLVSMDGAWGLARFVDCKLGAAVSLVTGGIVSQAGQTIELINCDSADTNYRYFKQTYQGTITQETTIVRTGGASDGTTPISRKMVSSADSQFFSPLELGPLAIWNESVGSPITATIEVITDGVTLTDAEAWLEVEYLGTSGYPLSVFASDRAASILATPANQTASTETWTTTGLTSPVKQKLSVTFTPQEKGLIRCRVMLAKASTTVYVDPKITISDSQGTTQQYQCGSEYVNGPYEPTGSSIAAAVWAYAKRTLTR